MFSWWSRTANLSWGCVYFQFNAFQKQTHPTASERDESGCINLLFPEIKYYGFVIFQSWNVSPRGASVSGSHRSDSLRSCFDFHDGRFLSTLWMHSVEIASMFPVVPKLSTHAPPSFSFQYAIRLSQIGSICDLKILHQMNYIFF